MTTKKLPEHIAIIMDGNGRWASERNLKRTAGHREGAKALHKIIRACFDLKIPMLTVFAFGSDNWRRPADEVDELMEMFLQALKEDVSELHQSNVRLCFIGDHSVFGQELQAHIKMAEDMTAHNTGLTLITAINYSGCWDICEAAKQLSSEVLSKTIVPTDISPERFRQKLATAAYPDPDLFIRTSGEQRLSNFMLWQLAYTELYFAPCYWPDFTEEEFKRALAFYAGRERRFGCTSEQLGE